MKGYHPNFWGAPAIELVKMVVCEWLDVPLSHGKLIVENCTSIKQAIAAGELTAAQYVHPLSTSSVPILSKMVRSAEKLPTLQ